MENLFKIYFICQPDQENVKEHNMRIVQELQKPQMDQMEYLNRKCAFHLSTMQFQDCSNFNPLLISSEVSKKHLVNGISFPLEIFEFLLHKPLIYQHVSSHVCKMVINIYPSGLKANPGLVSTFIFISYIVSISMLSLVFVFHC